MNSVTLCAAHPSHVTEATLPPAAWMGAGIEIAEGENSCWLCCLDSSAAGHCQTGNTMQLSWTYTTGGEPVTITGCL